MQNFKIKVGGMYSVANGNKAKILFRQPDDVEDSFPFVGYILEDSGHKAGTAWNEYGENSEEVEADDIVSSLSLEADLGQWVKNHSLTILTCLRMMGDGGHGKAAKALAEYEKILNFYES